MTTPRRLVSRVDAKDTGADRYRVETFQAVWVGESLPVLVVSGWYEPTGRNPGRRLELRCDGTRIAVFDCSGSAPPYVFRMETGLPERGTRFELVASESGAVLATQDRSHLWARHVRDTYATFCSRHAIRPHLREILSEAVAELERRPKMTLILQVTPESLSRMNETIESCREQVYPEWEALIPVEETTAGLLRESIDKRQDPRLRLVYVEDGSDPWQGVNEVSLTSTGEMIGLLRAGDRLAPQALFELALHLQSHAVEEAPDVFYADHDFIDSRGARGEPHLKPDWSPTFFLGHDYIDRFAFVRSSLFARVGGYDASLQEAAPYNLLLRITEETERVVHIPQVLFHAGRHRGWEPLWERQREARQGALQRRGLPAHPADTVGESSRSVDRVENLDWSDEGPRVTLIIPTFNHYEILRRCVESVLQKTTYLDFDVLVVDNGSDCPKTLSYLQQVCSEPRVRTLRVPRSATFSFSHVNNVAVQATDADYVLLLNNDTEVLEPRWLSRMMGYARLPGVGVTGARLLYPNGTLQHAGIALGMNDGLAPGHLFYGRSAEDGGYLHLAEASREVSAVTGACLLTRRELFLEIGGLDEKAFPTVLNDVDYCLRVAERGLRTVYVAHARLLHLESASRSRQDDPSQLAAFKRRHGGKSECYWSPSLELTLGWDVAVDPRGHLGYESLLRRPLRLLWALPEESEKAKEVLAAARSTGEHLSCENRLLPAVRSAWRGSTGTEDGFQWVDGAHIPSLRGVWDDQQALTELIKKVRRSLETERPDVLIATSLEAFPYINAAAAASIPAVWLLPENVSREDMERRTPAPARHHLEAALASAQIVAVPSREALDSWKVLDTRRVMVVSPMPQDVGRLVAEAWQIGADNGPRFGLLVDVEEASEEEVRATIESIRQQAYPAWDLCLVGGVRAARLFGFLRVVDSFDYRFSVRITEDPECDMAARRNDALATMPSTWVGILDPGDRLEPFALDELAAFIDKNPGCEAVYADETRVTDADGQKCVRLKPEWSPEMLMGEFYIGRPWVLRKSLFDRLGGFRAESGAAAEWDLWLRAGERGADVRRVSIPCCVRGRNSTWDEAHNGSCVVRDYLSRLGLQAEVDRLPNGVHRATWPVGVEPLVSIIIPNRNNAALIRECLSGLLQRTGYERREILIVDNASTDPEVLELYDSLSRRGDAQVVPLEGAFNYSVACNLGARHANGELLLFLNNDIEVLDTDWLEEMVRWAQLPGVGVVGCKLLYEDGRIQHAGVTLGLNGLSGHLFYGAPGERTTGPFGSADQYRNLMAVTGACQLLPRAVYEHVGGFDERYTLIYSDVDICLRAWGAGYRVVYTPFARLVHHEGSSRAELSPREDGDLFARRLVELGIDSDPYFHPGLNGESALPRLRRLDEPGAPHILRWYVNHSLESKAVSPPLDPHRVGELQRLVSGWELELRTPSTSVEELETSDTGAADFIVATLLQDQALHARFPTALKDGEDGAFCHWLTEDRANELGLSAIARRRIRDVFQEKPGDSIRGLYMNRHDLQRDHPCALLPVGLPSFVRWLLTTGRAQYGVSDESIWWYCLESWEEGADGLFRSFLINPSWQILFPDALTPLGWHRFVDWLAKQHPAASGWLRRVAGRLPDLPGAGRADNEASSVNIGVTSESGGGDPPGVNILANFCYPSGVQQAALASVEALRLSRWRTSCRDVPTAANPLWGADAERWPDFLGREVFDHTLLHVQPDILPRAYQVAGLAPRSDTFRIGTWYWELETPPPEPWVEACSKLDEIWAPSQFIAEAFRSVMPVKVVLMPPGVPRPEFVPKPRSHFGLDPDRFLFYFTFDSESITERKNPRGLIRAFRRAFDPEEKVSLAIKMVRGRLNVVERQRFLKAAEEARVTIVEGPMPRDESLALLNACDCYVSLHRSEGLGLHIAEAMLLEKPAIVTAYSGNMDFTTPENSLLVDFERVELERDYPPYPKGGTWAEPSEEHAAHWMRWVFEHREEARELGLRARLDLEERMSVQKAGERMVRRLRELGAGK